MDDDFKALLFAFNAKHVEYVIVGGYAVSFHAQPRATKNLDVLIGPDVWNAQAVHAALTAFGVPLDHLSPTDLIAPGVFFRMGAPPRMVDILPDLLGVEFGEAWTRRVGGIIDQVSGLTAWFMCREDLIAAKLATGRREDLGDVAVLRESDPHSTSPDIASNG